MDLTLEAAIAAHRFGLGEPDWTLVGPDPRRWLLGQLGPADPAWGDGLLDSEGTLEVLKQRGQRLSQLKRMRGQADDEAAAQDLRTEAKAFREQQRLLVEANLRSSLGTATRSARPWNERLVMFWANHFTVSEASGKLHGLAGAFEREAIRPHLAGRFKDMLRATTLHPAMLRFLDNQRSVGPQSLAAERRPQVRLGLNENLAREVLELHTLGAEVSRDPSRPGGYTQADVTAFAQVLTGWTSVDDPQSQSPTRFEPRRHQPGPKTVLGRVYPQGPQALDQVLEDLALHPATAQHLAQKLARHVVADEPPPSLVERLRRAYLDSGGDLRALHGALVQAPEAWALPQRKLKTPQEHALSCARLLGADVRWLKPSADGGIGLTGQLLMRAPSPAGWPDRAEDWLAPDGVWKRIEWTQRFADRFGDGRDARVLATRSLGPLLSENTRQQIDRAADGTQALVLLMMSPEFQRR
ncbi:DUF1800 domain-containing protein [Ideonella oryzae]|uniref:DUF1800 domain-containing protein n=1 Tax=Ideonella oryzae TaxID=2937441 RepID=A0ABT1BNX9_9BURK|nr:DUF1800 domain-containing protein [Ideonella oryzae]MCO5977912.1 DUF1800 domain-containing protein [Ideonella oryzae]